MGPLGYGTIPLLAPALPPQKKIARPMHSFCFVLFFILGYRFWWWAWGGFVRRKKPGWWVRNIFGPMFPGGNQKRKYHLCVLNSIRTLFFLSFLLLLAHCCYPLKVKKKIIKIYKVLVSFWTECNNFFGFIGTEMSPIFFFGLHWFWTYQKSHSKKNRFLGFESTQMWMKMCRDELRGDESHPFVC